MRVLLSLVLLTGGLMAQSRSALETDPNGWRDIMPSASFQGWSRLSIPPGQPVSAVSQWKVDPSGKALICEGNGGHDWLKYDREYEDFIFHAEYRFTKIENGKGYNSGVFVRNSADGAIWHQAQTGSSGGGWLFGVTPVNGKPERFNLREQMKESRVKEAGEWNTYEIRAQGKKITAWVNGAVVSEFDKCEMPKGYVGLEAEGYRIEFRNLKVKELR